MSATPNTICLLGDGGVGKTSLVLRFCLGEFPEEYDPTIEDSYRKQTVVDGEASLIEIIDTSGQEEFSAFREQWIRNASGYMIVYAINSRSSFDAVPKLIESVIRTKGDSPSITSRLPIVMVGNKCDLEAMREVSREEALEYAASRTDMRLLAAECSAKLNTAVEETFHELIRKMRNTSHCFPTDTLIRMADCNSCITSTSSHSTSTASSCRCWLPMSHLQIGDRVLSWDFDRQTTAVSTIVKIHRGLTSPDRLIAICTSSGATIVSTRTHPYWSPSKNTWCAVSPAPNTAATDSLTLEDSLSFASTQHSSSTLTPDKIQSIDSCPFSYPPQTPSGEVDVLDFLASPYHNLFVVHPSSQNKQPFLVSNKQPNPCSREREKDKKCLFI